MSKTNCLEASTCVTCLQHTPENVACFSSFVALLRTNKQCIAVAHIQELFRAGAGPIEDENTKDTLKKKQGNPIFNLGVPLLRSHHIEFLMLFSCTMCMLYGLYVCLICNCMQQKKKNTIYNIVKLVLCIQRAVGNLTQCFDHKRKPTRANKGPVLAGIRTQDVLTVQLMHGDVWMFFYMFFGSSCEKSICIQKLSLCMSTKSEV